MRKALAALLEVWQQRDYVCFKVGIGMENQIYCQSIVGRISAIMHDYKVVIMGYSPVQQYLFLCTVKVRIIGVVVNLVGSHVYDEDGNTNMVAVYQLK